MAELTRPDVRFHLSWLAAADEFDGEHVAGAGADRLSTAELRDPAVFCRFVESRIADGHPETPRIEGWVPATYLWIVDADTFLGSISVRHQLTPWLLEHGGHIGYSVRPSARRRGHATKALADALPVARGLGIDRVLVTCDVDNVGSRRTIEKNGGVYENTRTGKLRYWIDVRAEEPR